MINCSIVELNSHLKVEKEISSQSTPALDGYWGEGICLFFHRYWGEHVFWLILGGTCWYWGAMFFLWRPKRPAKRVLNCPGRFGKLTFKMKTFSLRLELRFILIITIVSTKMMMMVKLLLMMMMMMMLPLPMAPPVQIRLPPPILGGFACSGKGKAKHLKTNKANSFSLKKMKE